MAKPGDIFVSKSPDGRYTAVRVLRRKGKSFLISSSPYLAAERPKLHDPILRETLTKNRFYCEGRPATIWLDGEPPKGFELLGNIPVMKKEAQVECNVYGGKWAGRCVDEAFLEWRWIHDRPAFEEEARKKKEQFLRQREIPQEPKKMMSEREFWSIIDLLDWKHEGNDKRVLAPAVRALATKSKVGICQFEERIAYLLYQLDTRGHMDATGDGSADGFLYARCVVVANGRQFYKSVLKDPSQMPKDLEFESLLGLASSAYKLKTGEEFEYCKGCSYDSFSNPIGWAKQ